MTRNNLSGWIYLAIAYFAVLLLAGFFGGLYAQDHVEGRALYAIFKDMIPILIAIPVVWLAYCIQQRIAFLQQLRQIWSILVDAVQTAIQYTYLRKPTPEDHAAALFKLSVAIDEVRGLFQNFGETKAEHGNFAFEPIKNIYGLISELGGGENFKRVESERIRLKVFALWKDVRVEFLKEFDREPPAFSPEHWKDLKRFSMH